MKKLIVAAMIAGAMLAGCGQAKSEERTADDINYSVPMFSTKYKSYFDATEQEIIDKINNLSDGHFDTIYQMESDYASLWTQNGDYWVISFTDDTPSQKDDTKYPYKITLDFSACGDSLTAGYMAEAMIGAFMPEEVDNVTYWLDLYQENPDVDHTINLITGDYGYLSFELIRDDSLSISANAPLEEEAPPIVPQKP